MILQIQCEHCRHEFEAAVETGPIECPACGMQAKPKTTPRKFTIPPPKPAPVPVPIKKISESESLKSTANAQITVAYALFCIALLFIAIGVLAALADDKSNALELLGVGGGFISAGVVLYIIGQLVHLRANTCKSP
jgi:DNA-directed RNA polymerase subunit RPC12/RpoP